MAAGEKLQQMCDLKGNVVVGDFAVTGGANLACKHVFHAVCPDWNGGAGEKVRKKRPPKSNSKCIIVSIFAVLFLKRTFSGTELKKAIRNLKLLKFIEECKCYLCN